MHPSSTQRRKPQPRQPSGGLDLTQLVAKANALEQSGQAQQAVALYRQWLAQPNTPAATAVVWFNLGVLLRPLGDLPGCMHAYRQALAHNPNLHQAAVNLGLALEATGQREQALQTWQQALATQAQTLLLNHTGRVQEALKNYPAAENALLRSLLTDPDQPAVTQHYMGARRRQCLWPTLPPLPLARQPDPLDIGPFYALAEFEDPASQLEAARRFVQRRLPSPPLPAPLAAGKQYGHQRLRIGYLSGDFRMHAVSFLTAEVFELHNRDRVQVYGLDYSNDDGSDLRKRVLRSFDVHVPLHTLSDAQAAQEIARHEIDVLVDLTGLTQGSRFGILPLRPAPVQVSWLGYMGSSGLPGVDHVLADRFVLPEALQAHFTEKPLYLPQTYQVNDRSRPIGTVPTRASQGLPEGAVVLCSFNNNYKITPEVFAVWMRILRRAPHAVLWLLEDNPCASANLREHARAAGVAPERLHFAGRVLPPQYLARYRCADLFLDTSPYNAGTTASDALWAGLPVLTCPGRSMVSRMAGSLVRAAGLPELAVENWQAYEDMAVELARNAGQREQLKARLLAQRETCALFDTPTFVRDLEDVLWRAWQESDSSTAGVAAREPAC